MSFFKISISSYCSLLPRFHMGHTKMTWFEFSNALKTANCPHMLFNGRLGTGKTASALAIAHQLFGVLELNGTDDRRINVVQTKIKDFTTVAVGSGHRQGYALIFCDKLINIGLPSGKSLFQLQAERILCVQRLAAQAMNEVEVWMWFRLLFSSRAPYLVSQRMVDISWRLHSRYWFIL
ncbi:hypothetical protein REPUB_Repub03eG0183800 [Reevesia pubescens]